MLDFTHAPEAQSWVESANQSETDFPLQNLPWGRFRTAPDAAWRVGVAIGDQVLDVRACGLLGAQSLAEVMALPAHGRRALRHALWRGLEASSPQADLWRSALWPQAQVECGLPCEVGDYTDFYSGIHHATTVGKLFRPDQPLLPNYRWVPIGYHGRASSIVPSGAGFRRPRGQSLPAGTTVPRFGPCQRLDYELELGAWIGPGNALGEPVAVDAADEHIAGLTLLNDWSARDIQAWEYQPLGPFLAKNFATTVSPWLVTLDALAPFRVPLERDPADPQPLPYLDSASNRTQGAYAIELEVWLETAAMRSRRLPALRLSRSNSRDAYWTLAQLVAHHTVGGCNLRTGDVLGTGTLSGPAPDQGGSLLELSQAGRAPLQLPHGEERTFLADGDTIILRAHASRAGARRIGFGDCVGTVLPALEA